MAAFDKLTGKMVWGAGDQWGPSYASPVPANVNGKRRVFVFAGGESTPPTGGVHGMCGYHAAQAAMATLRAVSR